MKKEIIWLSTRWYFYLIYFIFFIITLPQTKSSVEVYIGGFLGTLFMAIVLTSIIGFVVGLFKRKREN